MYSICKLYIRGDKIPKIKVKGVPEKCFELNEMSEQITRNLKLHNNSFVYRGEPLSQWTENLRLLICKLERGPRTFEERQKILTKYNHCCARCEEKLDNVKYDLDHITPLCDNGEDVLTICNHFVCRAMPRNVLMKDEAYTVKQCTAN